MKFLIAMIMLGLLLFVAVHFFYDPYVVIESIASSKEIYELQAGDPEVRLVVLSGVTPGIHYRVAVRVAWDSVEAGTPPYKRARIVFASYDKNGRWVPSSPHGVCGVIGSGHDSFESVLPIPEGAASTRLAFQHLGRAGFIRLERFSLQQVEFKNSAPVVFRGLQILWFLMAIWAVWHLRLLRRRGGIAVVFVAGLIAAGMLLPGSVVSEVPDRMADLVRPAKTASPSLTGGEDGHRKTEEGRSIVEVVRSERSLVADRLLSVDFNLLGHTGLFLLLGAVCGVCFIDRSVRWHRVVQVFAGGAIYAVAAELLQVTELTRTVGVSDIGVNILGWLTGLFIVALGFHFFWAAGSVVRRRTVV